MENNPNSIINPATLNARKSRRKNRNPTSIKKMTVLFNDDDSAYTRETKILKHEGDNKEVMDVGVECRVKEEVSKGVVENKEHQAVHPVTPGSSHQEVRLIINNETKRLDQVVSGKVGLSDPCFSSFSENNVEISDHSSVTNSIVSKSKTCTDENYGISSMNNLLSLTNNILVEKPIECDADLKHTPTNKELLSDHSLSQVSHHAAISKQINNKDSLKFSQSSEKPAVSSEKLEGSSRNKVVSSKSSGTSTNVDNNGIIAETIDKGCEVTNNFSKITKKTPDKRNEKNNHDLNEQKICKSERVVSVSNAGTMTESDIFSESDSPVEPSESKDSLRKKRLLKNLYNVCGTNTNLQCNTVNKCVSTAVRKCVSTEVSKNTISHDNLEIVDIRPLTICDGGTKSVGSSVTGHTEIQEIIGDSNSHCQKTDSTLTEKQREIQEREVDRSVSTSDVAKYVAQNVPPKKDIHLVIQKVDKSALANNDSKENIQNNPSKYKQNISKSNIQQVLDNNHPTNSNGIIEDKITPHTSDKIPSKITQVEEKLENTPIKRNYTYLPDKSKMIFKTIHTPKTTEPYIINYYSESTNTTVGKISGDKKSEYGINWNVFQEGPLRDRIMAWSRKVSQEQSKNEKIITNEKQETEAQTTRNKQVGGAYDKQPRETNPDKSDVVWISYKNNNDTKKLPQKSVLREIQITKLPDKPVANKGTKPHKDMVSKCTTTIEMTSPQCRSIANNTTNKSNYSNVQTSVSVTNGDKTGPIIALNTDFVSNKVMKSLLPKKVTTPVTIPKVAAVSIGSTASMMTYTKDSTDCNKPKVDGQSTERESQRSLLGTTEDPLKEQYSNNFVKNTNFNYVENDNRYIYDENNHNLVCTSENNATNLKDKEPLLPKPKQIKIIPLKVISQFASRLQRNGNIQSRSPDKFMLNNDISTKIKPQSTASVTETTNKLAKQLKRLNAATSKSKKRHLENTSPSVDDETDSNKENVPLNEDRDGGPKAKRAKVALSNHLSPISYQSPESQQIRFSAFTPVSRSSNRNGINVKSMSGVEPGLIESGNNEQNHDSTQSGHLPLKFIYNPLFRGHLEDKRENTTTMALLPCDHQKVRETNLSKPSTQSSMQNATIMSESVPYMSSHHQMNDHRLEKTIDNSSYTRTVTPTLFKPTIISHSKAVNEPYLNMSLLHRDTNDRHGSTHEVKTNTNSTLTDSIQFPNKLLNQESELDNQFLNKLERLVSNTCPSKESSTTKRVSEKACGTNGGLIQGFCDIEMPLDLSMNAMKSHPINLFADNRALVPMAESSRFNVLNTETDVIQLPCVNPSKEEDESVHNNTLSGKSQENPVLLKHCIPIQVVSKQSISNPSMSIRNENFPLQYAPKHNMPQQAMSVSVSKQYAHEHNPSATAQPVQKSTIPSTSLQIPMESGYQLINQYVPHQSTSAPVSKQSVSKTILPFQPVSASKKTVSNTALPFHPVPVSKQTVSSTNLPFPPVSKQTVSNISAPFQPVSVSKHTMSNTTVPLQPVPMQLVVNQSMVKQRNLSTQPLILLPLPAPNQTLVQQSEPMSMTSHPEKITTHSCKNSQSSLQPILKRLQSQIMPKQPHGQIVSKQLQSQIMFKPPQSQIKSQQSQIMPKQSQSQIMSKQPQSQIMPKQSHNLNQILSKLRSPIISKQTQSQILPMQATHTRPLIAKSHTQKPSIKQPFIEYLGKSSKKMHAFMKNSSLLSETVISNKHHTHMKSFKFESAVSEKGAVSSTPTKSHSATTKHDKQLAPKPITSNMKISPSIPRNILPWKHSSGNNTLFTFRPKDAPGKFITQISTSSNTRMMRDGRTSEKENIHRGAFVQNSANKEDYTRNQFQNLEVWNKDTTSSTEVDIHTLPRKGHDETKNTQKQTPLTGNDHLHNSETRNAEIVRVIIDDMKSQEDISDLENREDTRQSDKLISPYQAHCKSQVKEDISDLENREDTTDKVIISPYSVHGKSQVKQHLIGTAKLISPYQVHSKSQVKQHLIGTSSGSTISPINPDREDTTDKLIMSPYQVHYKSQVKQHLIGTSSGSTSTSNPINTTPLKCSICNKFFKARRNLRNHLHVHSTERPYACSECGKTFKLRANVKRHFLVHRGYKQFQCMLCGMKFSRRESLAYHVRNSHQLPFYKDDHPAVDRVVTKSPTQ